MAAHENDRRSPEDALDGSVPLHAVGTDRDAGVVHLEPADIRLAEVSRWVRSLVEPEELGDAVLCVTDSRGRVTDVHAGVGRAAAAEAGLRRGADLGSARDGGTAVSVAIATDAPLAQVRHSLLCPSGLAGWVGVAGPVRLATGRPLAFVALYEAAEESTLSRTWLAAALRVLDERQGRAGRREPGR